jgi:rSAM/selenodomain-associated transferase 2/rSAM/selenodomain-associated transferase 1
VSKRPGRERLIVFTRWPEAGKVKTRLVPSLGPDGAADLHRRMAESTVEEAMAFAAGRASGHATVQVRFSGGDAARIRKWLGRPGSDLDFAPQGPGGLGERMARAFGDAFASGARAAVIIGTDCPGLTADVIAGAFAAAREGGLVLGPAADGGYYLIGMCRDLARSAVPQVFKGIVWGTGEVLNQTLARAREAGLAARLLETLADVDRPEELPLWERALAAAREPRVSVAIPTLDEAAHIERAVASAAAGANIEVIIADGGSADGTPGIAERCGARVVRCARGRARQMNAGARVATGGALLFLHADTALPAGSDRHVRRALSCPGVSGGAFEFRLDNNPEDRFGGVRREPSLLERMVNWRARRLGLPYGDQAIFVPAERFRAIGGFREMPVMEDVDLVRRLGLRGRVEIVPAPAVTSSRRWRERGAWRTSAMNLACVAAYFLGVAPTTIARTLSRT